MNCLEKLQRYNYPMKIIGMDVLEGEYDAVLSGGQFPPPGATHSDTEVLYNGEHFCHYHNGIAISDEFYDSGITAEYLDTPITGMAVYAPLVGCGQFLPTGRIKYVVSESSGTNFTLSDNWTATGNTRPYKLVHFEAEKTLGDLYKNACNYAYFRETDCFEPLPEAGAERRRLEVIKELTLLREVGTLYSRLENINLLIHFLASKATLTDDERSMISPLLDISPNMADVAAAAYDQADVIRISQADRAKLKGYVLYPSSVIVTAQKEITE